jgi:hypothetical protein
MADAPQYPKRDKFFAYRLVRLLTKTAAAQEIGALGCWFVTLIALQEDAIQYRRPVSYWDHQLGPLLGTDSKSTLSRLRKKLVHAGWIHYVPGTKGKIGRYWTTIPTHACGISDSPTDESDSDLWFQNETECETNVKRIRNECETNVKRNERPFLPNSNSVSDSKENAPQEKCSKIEHDETDAVVVPMEPYGDWVTAHAEFFLIWNDSPWTAPHTNAMPFELHAVFRDRWLDPKWKADLPVAIARLARFPPFHGRKIFLDEFLRNSLYPTKIINGGFDESANRNAATGTGGRRSGKSIPSHLAAGGRPVDPNADVPF